MSGSLPNHGGAPKEGPPFPKKCHGHVFGQGASTWWLPGPGFFRGCTVAIAGSESYAVQPIAADSVANREATLDDQRIDLESLSAGLGDTIVNPSQPRSSPEPPEICRFRIEFKCSSAKKREWNGGMVQRIIIAEPRFWKGPPTPLQPRVPCFG